MHLGEMRAQGLSAEPEGSVAVREAADEDVRLRRGTLCTENSSGLRLWMGNGRAVIAPKLTNHELMIRQLDLFPASPELRGYAPGVLQAHHKVSSQVRAL
jgi:hypothetical protein